MCYRFQNRSKAAYTFSEAAELLLVSKSTVGRMLKKLGQSAVRIGNKWYIAAKWVDELVRVRTNESQEVRRAKRLVYLIGDVYADDPGDVEVAKFDSVFSAGLAMDNRPDVVFIGDCHGINPPQIAKSIKRRMPSTKVVIVSENQYHGETVLLDRKVNL